VKPNGEKVCSAERREENMMVNRPAPRFWVAAIVLCVCGASAWGAAGAAAKNWSPPAHRIYAQALADEIMAKHPDLQSVTFHGVPPGMDKVYTMFAGSYPDRIGNPDDPDDIDVIVKGITIVDSRWRRYHDTVKRFVVQEPLRDKLGANVGLIVYAFKTANGAKSERFYVDAAMEMRDALEAEIPSYQALFEPAK
jgi:hypothetical protein